MSFNKIVFGEPKRNESPSVSVRPPTESGPATLIDLTSGQNTSSQTGTAPSSVAGDRIYFWVVQSSNQDALDSTPTGFTLGREAGNGGGSNPPLNWLFYQDVTTPPTSLEMPTTDITDPNTFVWVAWTVRGGESHTISNAAGATDSSTNDPPAVAPADVPGTYLVFAVNGFNADDGASDTKEDVGGSTGYTPIAYVGSGFTSPHAFVQKRDVDITTSENPDSYVYPSSAIGNWWTAVTIAVKYDDPEVPPPDHTHIEADITDTATGVATILNGNASIAVNHGLSTTPTNVLVTPRADPGDDVWVDTIGATQFTINVGTNVVADTDFGWLAFP